MRKIVFFHHLPVVHQVKIITSIPGFIHENVRFGELSIILVGCHHVNVKTLLVGSLGDGADHIIRLKTGHFQHRDIIGPDNILDDRNGALDIFRCCFTLCLVSLKLDMAKSGTRGIKSNSNM